MSDKFLGVGLSNAVGLTLLTIVMILLLKVVLTRYPVKGVSEAMQAV